MDYIRTKTGKYNISAVRTLKKFYSMAENEKYGESKDKMDFHQEKADLKLSKYYST